MKTNAKHKSSCGCSCGGGPACGSNQEYKLEIDFLYLDLTVCSRCQSTESTLLETLREIKIVLSSAGYDVHVNKIHIDSIEKAIKYRFVSSPTIRVNGEDIAPDTLESQCESCGDLCGTEIDCRDWLFESKRYANPPKALITREILRHVFSPMPKQMKTAAYKVPANIRLFFKSKEAKDSKNR